MLEKSASVPKKKKARMIVMIITMMVVATVSLRVGQWTFPVSTRTCRMNSPGETLATLWVRFRCFGFRIEKRPAGLWAGGAGTRLSEPAPTLQARGWQEWRDSNPRPSVLETDALPTELHSCSLAFPYSLLHDLGDNTGADGASALADGEAQALVHRDRQDQLDRHPRVVARHHHLGAVRQRHHARHVGRAEVELR